MNTLRLTLLAVLICLVSTTAYPLTQPNRNAMNDTNSTTAAKDVTVEMKTSLGDVTLLLYGDTPRHLENFVKLVNEGYYNGVLFHRVINDFMVQTGDPDSRTAVAGQHLGSGGPSYRIDAEFVYPKHFHKYGALAAAREGDMTNPTKASSGSQFYIVTGRRYSPGQLEQMEQRMKLQAQKDAFDALASQHRDSIMSMRRNRDQAGLQALQEQLIAESDSIAAKTFVPMTPEQIEAYSTVGGTPHLDGTYTVFGEVISGMDVIDRIQKVETDGSDRPLEDVRVISMRVLSE